MDAMLNKIADFYDDEVDAAVGGADRDDRAADDGVPRRRGRRLPHRHVPADLLDRRCDQVAQRDGAATPGSSGSGPGWSGSRRSAPPRPRLLSRSTASGCLSRPSTEAARRRGLALVRGWSACIYLAGAGPGAASCGSKPGARSALRRRWPATWSSPRCWSSSPAGRRAPSPSPISLAVVGAAILLGQRGALAAAAACSASFAGPGRRGLLGDASAPPVPVGTLSVGRLAFLCASNVLAQFLIAVLAGYLARQLTTAGGAALGARGETSASCPRCSSRSSPRCPRGSSPATWRGGSPTSTARRSRSSGSTPPAPPGNVEELIPGVRTLFTGKPRSRADGARRPPAGASSG